MTNPHSVTIMLSAPLPDGRTEVTACLPPIVATRAQILARIAFERENGCDIDALVARAVAGDTLDATERGHLSLYDVDLVRSLMRTATGLDDETLDCLSRADVATLTEVVRGFFG